MVTMLRMRKLGAEGRSRKRRCIKKYCGNMEKMKAREQEIVWRTGVGWSSLWEEHESSHLANTRPAASEKPFLTAAESRWASQTWNSNLNSEPSHCVRDIFSFHFFIWKWWVMIILPPSLGSMDEEVAALLAHRSSLINLPSLPPHNFSCLGLLLNHLGKHYWKLSWSQHSADPKSMACLSFPANRSPQVWETEILLMEK